MLPYFQHCACADPESFPRGGPTLSLMRGERIQISQKVDNYLSASETLLEWRFAGRPMMAFERCLGSFEIFQGIWVSIAMIPYFFVIFQEGSPPRSAHDCE